MPGAFTTVAAVKILLGLTVRTADGQLEGLVGGANQAFETYLQRDIFSASYSKVFNGTGTRTLMLPQYPVTAVSAVQIGAPNLTRRTLVENTDYVWTENAIELLAGVFCRGVANVAVAWTAGFATCPADLTEKATKLAATRYKELDRLGQNSKSMAGEVVSFDIKDFPNDVRQVLESYRKRFPI